MLRRPDLNNDMLISVSLQSQKTFVYLQNTNLDIFDEIWELSDPA